MEHAPGDKEANLARVEQFTRQAAAAGAQLVVFPECCISGYWFLRDLCRADIERLAERVPDGPSTRTLTELAVRHGLTVGAGLIEQDIWTVRFCELSVGATPP